VIVPKLLRREFEVRIADNVRLWRRSITPECLELIALNEMVVPSQNLIRAKGTRELAETAGFIADYFEMCRMGRMIVNKNNPYDVALSEFYATSSLVKTSNPNILMMEPAENRQRDDASNSV
jgi:hypothetical protein